MCEQMNYWKGYNSDESRGKAATSDNFPLRERRLFDVNNTSESSASKNFKDLELEAYVAISKLFLPPEVYEEWFGAKGRLVNWNSGDIRKTPDMPSACARESIGCEQIPDIKLPAHLSSTPNSEVPVHLQPAPKKGVTFLDIPSPQVSVRPKTSQVEGTGGASPILKKVVPLPFGVVFLGDSTISYENVSSIVYDNMLVMGSDSHHDMPPVRVLNLCDQHNPVGVQELLNDIHIIMQWASYKPRITVLALGTYDLISGNLCPTRRAYWTEIRRFCLHIQEVAKNNMNEVSRVEFEKLMDRHQFIVLPPLDFLEYKPKPGLVECHEYADIRSNAEKGLLMNRALLYNQARVIMCFTKVKSVGYELNDINQLRYNDKIAHCIARLVCKVCRLEDNISHNEHSDMMRRGCAHPGKSQPVKKI